MYPNQPPQGPPQYPPQPQAPIPTPGPTPVPGQPYAPVDYLNQIAPQGPKKPLFTFGIKQLVMIGGALVVLVIILAAIVGSITGGKKDPLEHLSARLTATQAVVSAAQPNLKSSELRSLNSNLNLYMTNTNRDITAPLTSAGINVKKLSKSIVTSESTTALSARLEDARLNAVYDRTYAREMTYQLGTLMTLMNQIYKSTSNAQLKTFLESAYTNLKPTQESFANFTPTE
jgi:predicted outer membrane protein